VPSRRRTLRWHRIRNAIQVLLTSLGHYQEALSEAPLEFLEVYEVLRGSTMMVFDRPDEPCVTAVIGTQGDKVLSPNRAIHLQTRCAVNGLGGKISRAIEGQEGVTIEEAAPANSALAPPVRHR
jgi:hypothetical protein